LHQSRKKDDEEAFENMMLQRVTCELVLAMGTKSDFARANFAGSVSSELERTVRPVKRVA
jgi:hypothetical protein